MEMVMERGGKGAAFSMDARTRIYENSGWILHLPLNDSH